MSDADNQMGGSGGETGRPPGAEDRPQEGKGKPDVDEESKESFPASDPPANY